MHIGRLLTSIGINAVPAFGWWAADWSEGTMLAVYWFENLAICLVLALQILIHRRFNPLRGHFDYQHPANDKGTARTYLLAYFPRAFFFVIGHAVFLAVILFLVFPKNFGPSSGINIGNFKSGALAELGLLALGFIVAIPRLIKSPFRWIEEEGVQSIGRILVVQFVILAGMFVVFMTNSPRGMFGIFIVLKTLTDIGQYVPQYNPKEPPKWLSNLMDRVPAQDGSKETFSSYWVKTDEAEAARQRRNEEPFTRR